MGGGPDVVRNLVGGAVDGAVAALRGGGGHGAQEKRISVCLFLRRVDLNGYLPYFLLTFPTSLRMWQRRGHRVSMERSQPR
jgi:hypothetical protein